jgi:hypothetical protein
MRYDPWEVGRKRLTCTQDHKTCKGRWYSSLAFEGARETWFSKSTDDGVLYQSYFHPIQPETIALLYTTVSFLSIR